MNEESDSGFEDFSDNEFNIQPNSAKSCKIERTLVNEGCLQDRMPPCMPLVNSKYSLATDLLLGWKPKGIVDKGPIPLSFKLDTIPVKNCLFYGFRPEDSLELHEEFSALAGYEFFVDPVIKDVFTSIKKRQKKKDFRPFLGMKQEVEPEELEFESKFEGGNLDKVAKVSDNEYHLYLRCDSNSGGHNQWFYFSICNNSSARELKLNIMNFSKSESLYTQGLQPCVFSTLNSSKGWRRSGSNIKYTQNRFIQRRRFYSLSFNLHIGSKDKIYVSYSIPYTYTRLTSFFSKFEMLKKEELCRTIGGVQVPLFKISDWTSGEDKPHVILTGRVHPGETHASFLVEGLVQFLLSPDEYAQKLRQRLVFLVVPMLNPDGVILGNSRCSLAGDDLNRLYHEPDSRYAPSIFYLKELIKKTNSSHKILMHLDFHSHSKKKGIFMYGPYYPLHSKKYYLIRALPKILSERTEMFRFHSCRFRYEWSKRNTARLAIARQFKIPICYTVEASLHGYLNASRETIAFNEENLKKSGQHIARGILQYLELRDEERLKKKNVRNRLLELYKRIDAEAEVEDSEGGNSDSDEEQEPTPKNQKIKSRIEELYRQINLELGLSTTKNLTKDTIKKIRKSARIKGYLKKHGKKTFGSESRVDKKKKIKPLPTFNRIVKTRPNSRNTNMLKASPARENSCIKPTIFQPHINRKLIKTQYDCERSKGLLEVGKQLETIKKAGKNKKLLKKLFTAKEEHRSSGYFKVSGKAISPHDITTQNF